jgi:hypothetical protein
MAWKKLPKNFGTTGRQQTQKGTRSLDALDLEACAEGDAIKAFKTSFGGKQPLGKRIAKMRNSESRGAALIGNKRVVNLTKDHKAAMDKYMIKDNLSPRG